MQKTDKISAKKWMIVGTAVLLVALIIVIAVKCGNGKEDLSNVEYGARTAAFYSNVTEDSFWLKMMLTEGDTSCTFTQATNGETVTTIRDYDENKYDLYEINVGNAVHQLDTNGKMYDTVLTEDGQEFIFGDYNQTMFTVPYSYGVSTFEGEQYYCEIFSTETSPSGKPISVNKYYFSFERLIAIEMVENGKTVMTMKLDDYSSEIPEDILFSVPDDYAAGELIYEHPAIDYSDVWGDMSFD